MKESFESFNDENATYFQPRSLLLTCIERLASLMITRKDLVPAAQIMRRVNDRLKPMLTLKYLHLQSTSLGGNLPSPSSSSSTGFINSIVPLAFMPVESLRVADAKLSQQDTESLVYFLGANKELRSIELRANKLAARSVYIIVNQLSSNAWPQLISLDLSFNRLDNLSIENITMGVSRMTGLRVVKLAGCKINPNGAALIGALLEEDRQIEELDLSFNAIAFNGAERLARAITKNTTLTSLNLRQNDVGMQGGEYIAQAMEFNQHIRVLCLVDNNVGPAVMSLLSGRIRGGMSDALLSFRANNQKELTVPALFTEARFNKRVSTKH